MFRPHSAGCADGRRALVVWLGVDHVQTPLESPRIRFMRNSSFCFSFEMTGTLSCISPPRSVLFTFQYRRGVCYNKNRWQIQWSFHSRTTAESCRKEDFTNGLHRITRTRGDGDDAVHAQNRSQSSTAQQWELNNRLKALRMNWVVVTGKNGARRLRLHWFADADCSGPPFDL